MFTNKNGQFFPHNNPKWICSGITNAACRSIKLSVRASALISFLGKFAAEHTAGVFFWFFGAFFRSRFTIAFHAFTFDIRSAVHRVGMHGISNADTRLYPLHNSCSLDNNRSAELWADHWWNVVGHTTRPCTHLRLRHPSSWIVPVKNSCLGLAWPPPQECHTFPHLVTQVRNGCFCCCL